MKLPFLFTLVGLAALAADAQAQTLILSSTTAPTAGSADIVQSNTSGTPSGSQDYDNQKAPVQTFTTGSNPLGYTVNSLTLKGVGGGNSFQTNQFAVGIYSAFPNGTANYGITYLGGNSNLVFDSTGANEANTYLTFGNLLSKSTGGAIVLSPNTLYAFSINPDVDPNNGFIGFAVSPNDTAYTGGTALNSQTIVGGTDPSTTGTTFTINQSNGYDRAFDLGLTAVVPEPQTWALMAVGFAGVACTKLRRLRALRKA